MGAFMCLTVCGRRRGEFTLFRPNYRPFAIGPELILMRRVAKGRSRIRARYNRRMGWEEGLACGVTSFGRRGILG